MAGTSLSWAETLPPSLPVQLPWMIASSWPSSTTSTENLSLCPSILGFELEIAERIITLQLNRTLMSGRFSKCTESMKRTCRSSSVRIIELVRTPSPKNRTPFSRFPSVTPVTQKSFSSPAPDLRCHKCASNPSRPFLPAAPRVPACSPPASQESARSSSAAPRPSALLPARRPCPSPHARPCLQLPQKFRRRDRHRQLIGCARRRCVSLQSAFRDAAGPAQSPPDHPRRGPASWQSPSSCPPPAHPGPPRPCTTAPQRASPCTSLARAATPRARSPPAPQSNSTRPSRTGSSLPADPPRCPPAETTPSARESPIPLFLRCTASAPHPARLRQSRSSRRSPPSPSSCAWLPRPLHRHGAGRRTPSCAPPQSPRFPPRAKNPGSVVLPSVHLLNSLYHRRPIIGQMASRRRPPRCFGCDSAPNSLYIPPRTYCPEVFHDAQLARRFPLFVFIRGHQPRPVRPMLPQRPHRVLQEDQRVHHRILLQHRTRRSSSSQLLRAPAGCRSSSHRGRARRSRLHQGHQRLSPPARRQKPQGQSLEHRHVRRRTRDARRSRLRRSQSLKARPLQGNHCSPR